MIHRFSPTLFAYLSRQYLFSVFATVAALSVIILIAEVLELLQKVGTRDLADETMIKLVAFKMPDMILQLAPFAILLGTLFCFARLSKNHELSAIRASGISVWEFLLPPAMMCLAIGLFNMTVLNTFSAATLKRYEKLNAQVFPGDAKGLLVEGGAIWLKQEDKNSDVIIHANKVHDQGRTLEEATVYRFTKDGRFMRMTAADKMTLEEAATKDKGRWKMENITVLTTNAPAQTKESAILDTAITVEKIQSSFTSPNTLSIWQMPGFIHTLEQTGFPTAMHQLHWQRLLSSPAVALAMFLLAVPFSLHLSRFGGVGKLIIVGLVCGFAFYLFSNIIGAFGLSGRLNIAVAAWMPTLIAALVGISLLLHFGEE